MDKDNDKIDPEGRYGATQAARLLGISRTSFYSIVRQGKIRKRFNDLSSRAYYLGRDLLRLINAL